MGLPRLKDHITVMVDAATRPRIVECGYRDVPFFQLSWTNLTVNLSPEQLQDLADEANMALMAFNDQQREERQGNDLPF